MILEKIEKRNPTLEDKVAVQKLLKKHVPDYKEQYKYLKVGEFTDNFIKDRLKKFEEKENGNDAAAKQRRRNLVNKFKELK